MKKLLFCCFLSLLAFFCCSGEKTRTLPQSSAVADTVVVRTTAIIQQEIPEFLKLTGEVAALYEIPVFTRTPGIITQKYVKTGDKVKEQQLLAEVEQDLPGLTFTPGKIEAPRAGVIIRDNVETGSRISGQEPLFILQQLDTVFIMARIIQESLSKVKIGMTAEIQIDGYPGRSFSGRISEIMPLVNPANRMASLKIPVVNRSGLLKPGMFTRVQVSSGSHVGFVVPIDAITRQGADKYLWVIRNHHAVQIQIKTGNFIENRTEVFGGISPGEQVVVLGQNLLDENVPVKIEEVR